MSKLKRIRQKVEDRARLNARDALALFRTEEIHELGRLAGIAAERKIGSRAYYVRNIHVNPSNLCVNRCRFCAFSRSMGEAGAYELDTRQILSRIRKAMPVEELHMVGGLHPDWPLEHYTRLLRRIRKDFPGLHIKAFTAVEIDYLARKGGLALNDTLQRLRQAGLGTMPGGGAEILNDDVRAALCPEKLGSEGWLNVMREAHRAGIKSNATMLYGHAETYEHRVEHLMKLRALQDETGGFQAFIPLSYHPHGTDMGGADVSGLDDLRTVAVSRLVLDNFPHVKAYWVMLGEKISQLALNFGADDLDGTVIEERITYAAGGRSRRGITEKELRSLIRKAGRRPVRRDSYYREAR